MLASHSSVDIWLGQHWKSACGKSETWVTVAGENCVWAKKETTATTTTKRRCLGPRAERNPGSCANPFCLWGDFWENVAIESVFLSVYRIPGRRWHFVKKFSDPWPPHPQNLRTVIDKQAYKHGVNFLFFVTHWKGERGATKLTSVTADRVQHLWNLVSDKDQHEKLSNYPITSLLGIVHQS